MTYVHSHECQETAIMMPWINPWDELSSATYNGPMSTTSGKQCESWKVVDEVGTLAIRIMVSN